MGSASRIHLPNDEFRGARNGDGNGTKWLPSVVRTARNATKESANIMLAQDEGGPKEQILRPRRHRHAAMLISTTDPPSPMVTTKRLP